MTARSARDMTLSELVKHYESLVAHLTEWEFSLLEKKDRGAQDVYLLRTHAETVLTSLRTAHAFVMSSYGSIPTNNLVSSRGDQKWVVTHRGTVPRPPPGQSSGHADQ